MRCHDAIVRALGLSKALEGTAVYLESDCGHDGCLVLSGLLRDSAARLTAVATTAGRDVPERRGRGLNGWRGEDRRQCAMW